MISKIRTSEDVRIFAKELIKEGIIFHPDDDFKEYIEQATKQPCYTLEEAEKRNELMNQSFDVCEKEGVDIYNIMMEVSLVETGMDKFIPLPSSAYAIDSN